MKGGVMPSYSNGYIPDNLLVTFHTGWNAAEGSWAHRLSPATYAKHLNLVALAKRNTGGDISVTDGWGAYRPYASQVYARQLYGNGAAWPGTSSHGGFWEGKQTLAIDYNWGPAYGWNRDAWFRDVRAVGLTPGLIHPSRGNNYPDEPWHVVDLDPWGAVPSTGGGKAPEPEQEELEEDEEEDMAMKGAHYKIGDLSVFMLFNEVSGFYVEHSGVQAKYNNSIAKEWGTNSWPEITEAHAKVIKRSLDAIRRTAVTGDLRVDLGS